MEKSKVAKKLNKIFNSNYFFPIITLLGVFLGVIIALNSFDFKPATNEDFKPLIEIQTSIAEDFDNVYNYPNTTIYISNDNLEITAENEQCSLKMFFDKNENYLYCEKADKSLDSFLSLLALLLFSTLGIVVVYMFVSLLFAIISEICEYLCDKSKRKN